MSKQAVLEAARADLGYPEYPPGSNRSKFGKWYGLDGEPWCVMALCYWFNKAGEGAAFFGGAKTARCSVLLQWYREQGQLVPLSEAQPADIAILNFNGKGTPDHCGLVEQLLTDGLLTIEGNTSPGIGMEGSQDNGGCVAQKKRYPSQIVAVCRPQYKEESKSMDDYSGHWAEDAITWALRTGLIKGYSDGTVRPDDHLTRAELVTILKRYDDYRFGGTNKNN